MNFRVILIDDEPWIIDGLRILIPWEKYGMSIVEAYTDPIAALNSIIVFPPDVVFTDIRMPEISGLDILHICRSRGISCEFIMVSGYSEFDYARDALRSGAFDYLIKPIDLEIIPELMPKLCKKINQNRQSAGFLALDDITTPDGAAKLLDPDSTNSDGWIMFYTNANAESAIAMVETHFSANISKVIPASPHHTVIVCAANSHAAADIRKKAALFSAALPCGMGTPPVPDGVNVGISGHCESVSGIPGLVYEAYIAYRQNYISQSAKVCAFERSDMRVVNEWILSTSHAQEHGAELSGFFLSLPDFFRKESLQVTHAEHIWNFYSHYFVDDNANVWNTAEELLTQFSSFSDQCSYMAQAVKKSDTLPSVNVNEHFMLLLEYVEQHYDSQLSLCELSSKYYLNVSYISLLFRKVKQMTFTEYVAKLRMTRALELLRDGKSLRDIAERVGYDDYFYFSRVFKKFYGVPPTQYSFAKYQNH